MAFIGKILTVLILIMSLMFMAFAVMNFATQRNYKALISGGDGGQGLNEKLRGLTDEVRKNQEEVDMLSNKVALELGAKRSALGVLEVHSLSAASAVEAKRAELEQLEIKHRRDIETLSTAQEDIRKLKDEADELRGEMEQIIESRNEEFETVAELTDKINQAEGVLRRLKERNAQLRGN